MSFPLSFWKLGSFERKRTGREIAKCVFPEPVREVVGLGGGAACAGVFAGAGVWLVSDKVWKPDPEYHSQEGPWRPHFHFSGEEAESQSPALAYL